MGKSIDHHSVQILNISRFQQKLRAEEALARLNQGGVLFAHTIVLKESSKSQLPLAGGVRGEGGSRRAVLALQEAEGRDGGNGARDERTQGK